MRPAYDGLPFSSKNGCNELRFPLRQVYGQGKSHATTQEGTPGRVACVPGRARQRTARESRKPEGEDAPIVESQRAPGLEELLNFLTVRRYLSPFSCHNLFIYRTIEALHRVDKKPTPVSKLRTPRQGETSLSANAHAFPRGDTLALAQRCAIMRARLEVSAQTLMDRGFPALAFVSTHAWRRGCCPLAREGRPERHRSCT